MPHSAAHSLPPVHAPHHFTASDTDVHAEALSCALFHGDCIKTRLSEGREVIEEEQRDLFHAASIISRSTGN